MNRFLLLALTAGLLSSCANRQYGSRWEAERACTDWQMSGSKSTFYDEVYKRERTSYARKCREEKETRRFIGMILDKKIIGYRVVRRFLY
jgi:hypothetical protein